MQTAVLVSGATLKLGATSVLLMPTHFDLSSIEPATADAAMPIDTLEAYLRERDELLGLLTERHATLPLFGRRRECARAGRCRIVTAPVWPRAAAVALAALLAGCMAFESGTVANPSGPAPSGLPLVIAHRGASGERPEHTLEAYRLAVEQGADFLEPDLVITRDGVLVARHENEIGETTDIVDRPEFADRRTTKTIDGVAVTGWFTEDFTLAELRTLRARERIPQLRPANSEYDGRFAIPTLDEIIELAKSESLRTGRTIGIYPETKHPTYFRGIGLPLEEPLVETLQRHGWNVAAAPVFIQSFEVANLRTLRGMTDVRLVQLLAPQGRPYDFAVVDDVRTYHDLASPAGLREIAAYAQGIGPHKDLVLPRDAEGRLGEPTTLVREAHALELVVHPWTFRSENYFLPTEHRRGDPADPAFLRERGDAVAELRRFFDAGVDGVFADHPEDAVNARVLPRLP